MLNKDQPSEKLIFWDNRHGFMSEDSENEQTKFNAFERKYKAERIQSHANNYLQVRPILPFERAILSQC